MFSPHQDDKGPDLDLDHHTHQVLVGPQVVPVNVPLQQQLMHHQPLDLQHVPQPDPFDPSHPQPSQPNDAHLQVMPSPVPDVLQLQHQHNQHQQQHQHQQHNQLSQQHNQHQQHQHQHQHQHSHQQPSPSDLQPTDLHLPDPHNDSLMDPANKKQRRRYDNNFKAEVLEHLKVPGNKLPQVAKNFGIPENTLREWTKVSVVQCIEQARSKHGGSLKANMFDPMHRLTESLLVFFDRNDSQPQHLKQPVTTKLVVSKGLEARNNLLELHDIQPFLEPKEKRALESFTGSDSWAKKFAKRHDLKMTGARVKELADDDVRNFSVQLRQMASRVKQAGPGYEEVAALLRQSAEKLISARLGTARRLGQPTPQLN